MENGGLFIGVCAHAVVSVWQLRLCNKNAQLFLLLFFLYLTLRIGRERILGAPGVYSLSR